MKKRKLRKPKVNMTDEYIKGLIEFYLGHFYWLGNRKKSNIKAPGNCIDSSKVTFD